MNISKYDNMAFDIVSNSKILTEDDFNIINNMKSELTDTFMKVQMFRTRTEMDVSVLNDVKFPTPDSKYWQAVREQNVMFQELCMLSYEYQKNQIEIEILKRDKNEEDKELERELIQIEINKKSFVSANQERTAKDRIREIKEWHDIKKKLIPQMTCGTKDVNEHQLVSYAQRFIQQMMVLDNSAGQAEKQNLVGQYVSTMKAIKKKGLDKKVFKIFNREALRKLPQV